MRDEIKAADAMVGQRYRVGSGGEVEVLEVTETVVRVRNDNGRELELKPRYRLRKVVADALKKVKLARTREEAEPLIQRMSDEELAVIVDGDPTMHRMFVTHLATQEVAHRVAPRCPICGALVELKETPLEPGVEVIQPHKHQGRMCDSSNRSMQAARDLMVHVTKAAQGQGMDLDEILSLIHI